jgi:hypothetical protein
LLLKRQFNYEKNDHCHFCAFAGWLNAGVLLERTRDDHYHNASNHCDCAAAAQYDDHNNAHERRLLVGRSRQLQVGLAGFAAFGLMSGKEIRFP